MKSATDLRTERALTEYQHVDESEFASDVAFAVHSGSGSTYTVNAATNECSCPDEGDENGFCKHLYAVKFSAELFDDYGTACPECRCLNGDIGCAHCEIQPELDREETTDLREASEPNEIQPDADRFEGMPETRV